MLPHCKPKFSLFCDFKDFLSQDFCLKVNAAIVLIYILIKSSKSKSILARSEAKISPPNFQRASLIFSEPVSQKVFKESTSGLYLSFNVLTIVSLTFFTDRNMKHLLRIFVIYTEFERCTIQMLSCHMKLHTISYTMFIFILYSGVRQ